MLHRHLNHSDFTLAALDDIIERGQREDWRELLRVIYTDPDGEVAQKVLKLCAARPARTPAFVFWERYVNWRRSAVQSPSVSES
jgi:hypothetical protein